MDEIIILWYKYIGIMNQWWIIKHIWYEDDDKLY